jgi:hypothetical protein
MPDYPRQNQGEPAAPQQPAPNGPIARLIDGFNPAVTLLMAVWVIGLTARRYLLERELLVGFADRALTSLSFVVPLMLVGWAVLEYLDKKFGTGQDDTK